MWWERCELRGPSRLRFRIDGRQRVPRGSSSGSDVGSARQARQPGRESETVPQNLGRGSSVSNAALAIWISSGGLLLSAGSLAVSVAAYRRSTLRRLDRPSEFGKVIAHLRLRLDQLERTIPEDARSRARAPAASGRAPRVGADSAAVREPRSRLDKAASTRKRVDNVARERTKSVTALQAGSRLEHLVQFMRDRARRPR